MKINEKVTSINLTPWGGEYSFEKQVVKTKDGTQLNDRNNDDISNIQDVIDYLPIEFPNLQNISIVVGWYADLPHFNLNEYDATKTVSPKDITIHPKASLDAINSTLGWKVADFENETAIILKDNQWSGTPTDSSLLNLVATLSFLGYGVRIYPMLFVDEKKQPWRGEIKPSNDAEVEQFFKEYDKFIKHYATLSDGENYLIDYIDSFLVGSEMFELTRYKNEQSAHTALKHFNSLAQFVHEFAQARNANIQISYAANWDEYHDPFMDEIWNSEYINFIGIDAYFPLGEKDTPITYENVIKGWESGENYEYKVLKNSNIKVLIEPSEALKNLKYWYDHGHSNKKIVFTEFGAGSNSETLKHPYLWNNYKAKPGNEYLKTYLEGSFDYWQSVYSQEEYRNMPNPYEDIYLWDYDSRGPDYYLYKDLYDDAGIAYETGLFLNGKLL